MIGASGLLLPLVLTVFAAGLLRALTGFGFALVAVPLLSLVLPPAEAVALTVLLQVAILPRDLRPGAGAPDRRLLAGLAGGAVIGLPLGQLALLQLDPDLCRLATAGFALAALAAQVASARIAARVALAPPAAVGGLSGFMAGLAAMPGPPAVLYALSQPLGAPVMRATLLAFFGGLALLSLPGLAWGGMIGGRLLGLFLLCLPLLLLADLSGQRMFHWLSPQAYRHLARLVLALSALAAVVGLMLEY